MKTALLSHIVIDEIHEFGAKGSSTAVGGAGAYAAVGASLVSQAGDPVLVSGIGRTDRDDLTRWCARRGINASGLFEVSDKSPRTLIEYFVDGERYETPAFGLDHFDAHTPYPCNIPGRQEDYAGVYLFHAHEANYWNRISAFRQTYRASLLWEISLESCFPEFAEIVRDHASHIDILSINLTEARRLLGDSTASRLVNQLGSWTRIVVLRMGPAGSFVRESGQTHHIGAGDVAVVDPTGGGNAFSGAFLAAYVENSDPVAAATRAAAAAATVIEHVGAPEVDDTIRALVKARAASVAVSPHE